MGRKNKAYQKPLRDQAYEELKSMQAFGQSKQDAVANGSAKDKIFAYDTYKTYWKATKGFLRWLRKTHPEVTVLRKAKKYVGEYLTARTGYRDRNGQLLSAWTIHTEAAALNKLFGITRDDPDRFVPPTRYRVDIKRSRPGTRFARDRHFSEVNNAELIAFCKGTGCRRGVLERLQGRDLWTKDQMERKLLKLSSTSALTKDEQKALAELREALHHFPRYEYFIYHHRDKNGKSRFAPIIGPDTDTIVARMRRTAPEETVWQSVNTNAPVHAYRSDYAATLYRENARPVDRIPYDRTDRFGKRYQSDAYHCRLDMKGISFDRKGLQVVSIALGHRRLDVVASNYLRGI